MTHAPLDPDIALALRRAIDARGLTPVARRLGVPRHSLANVLLGAARKGTVLQIAESARRAGICAPLDHVAPVHLA